MFQDELSRLIWSYFAIVGSLIIGVSFVRIVLPNVLRVKELKKMKTKVRGKINTKAYLMLPSFIGEYEGARVAFYFRHPIISFFIPVYFTQPVACYLEYYIRTPFIFKTSTTHSYNPSVATFLESPDVSEKINYLLHHFNILEFAGNKVVLRSNIYSFNALQEINLAEADKFIETIKFLVKKGCEFQG